MPQFFLDLFESGQRLVDEEGFETETFEMARRYAIEAARDVMAEEVRCGRLCLSWHIEIQNDAHQPMMTLSFRDALQISEL